MFKTYNFLNNIVIYIFIYNQGLHNLFRSSFRVTLTENKKQTHTQIITCIPSHHYGVLISLDETKMIEQTNVYFPKSLNQFALIAIGLNNLRPKN